MPPIPGRRAVLSAGGTLVLVLGTAPGLGAPLTGTASAPAPDTACAPAPGAQAAGGLGESLPTGPGFSPSTGTVSALTVFIDFPDAPATISTRERFAEFFPETAEQFAESSYGRLRYRAVPVHRWLRMSQPFEDYGIDRGAGWRPDDEQGYNRLLREIVAALDEPPPAAGGARGGAAGERGRGRDGPREGAAPVDFSDYDLVNVLATPNAGPPATERVLSVSFPGRDLVATAEGPLRNVSFIWSRQPGPAEHRVLVHENGHVFGLPDLYWTGAGRPPQLTGHWDVMEQDWGPPNDFLAWHKWKLGWLLPGQVDCVAEPGTSEHVLTPVGAAGTGGTRLLAVRTGDHEALAIEVRTPGALDEVVCRPGVLVSRISTVTRSGFGPVTVQDATPGSEGCQAVPDPQVTAQLTDAPFVPGETFRDAEAGVSVEVLDADSSGRHRVRVSRW
ncbi:M6 family metalloprotease domain-containing protein [Streptomyces hoynatensis]|uniref:M6 family metalloprotease domain-containing protein n=1 Tax=Streptomyces hoynatensis TaxID=1141874 RepID=A0A3A9YZV1_9ACTN|nr:M6 family metalloprotease domain-containing protein [Streptomyces hoynatensis]RKN41608.1 M6 family metalloprotease domain-containing protein [Streptomyces hoynatensis]